MTDLRKAAEMALDALKDTHYRIIDAGLIDQDLLNRNFTVATALRQALAQSEQEPVAWINKDGWFRSPKDADDDFRACAYPLYTAPPKREWVGLTDEEKGWCGAPTLQETVARVEAKLKEKNT